MLYAGSSAPTLEAKSPTESVVILVPPSVLERLQVFLRHGESPERFNDYARAGNYRDLTDYLLLRRALATGGNRLPVIVEPWLDVSYERVLLRLKAGHATVFSNGIWREDIAQGDSQVRASPPLFRYGEFEVGLYMSPQNPKLQTTKTLADLQKLSAVSSKQWRPDWMALESLGLVSIFDNVHWESMVKMVHSQRVDFMLAGFSTRPDLSYEAMGLTLKPIPGMKVKLVGSRGWAVSLSHPQGRKTYTVIAKGLAKMRRQGVIYRAYRDAGVINEAVAEWQVLNPEMVPLRTSH